MQSENYLIDKRNLGQGVKILIHLHFERSFRHETFIVTIPETDRREGFIQKASVPVTHILWKSHH